MAIHELQALTFPVIGITCATCASSVETMIGAQKVSKTQMSKK